MDIQKRLNVGPAWDLSHLFDEDYDECGNDEYDKLFAQGYNDCAPVQTPYRKLMVGALQTGLEHLMDLEEEEDSKPKRSCRRLTGAERQAALDKCGTWHQRRNPNTGMLISYPWECGLKECPNASCGGRRAFKLMKRVESAAIANKNIRCVHASGLEEAEKLVEMARGKENYLRLPQRDGSEYLFIRTDELIGEHVYCGLVEIMDWFALQNSPDGRNASGQLGKQVEEAKAADTYTVGTHSYLVEEADKPLASLLELETLAETMTYDPTTPEDVQRLINQRNFIYENKLIGAKVNFKVGEVRVFGNLSVTNWTGYIRIVLPSLVDKGFISQAQADQFAANYSAKHKDSDTNWYIEAVTKQSFQQLPLQ